MKPDTEKILSILASHENDPSNLIAILQDVQAEYNYLSEANLTLIADTLGLSVSKVYSVATFYENFSLEAKGKHIVKVCAGTACHVRKSGPIYDAIYEYLGLHGKKKTSDDGLFTLETVACLGACGLAPVMTVDGEVRLMGAYIVKCTGVDKNADGSIAAIHCTADLETGNGNPADGRKVKGTIHWVSADHAVDAEVRLYDKLFTEANMNAIPEGSDYKDYLNPESVVVRKGCKLEESLKDAKPGEKFQFVRTGFFTPDSKNPGVYNRVVTLRDSFKPAK